MDSFHYHVEHSNQFFEACNYLNNMILSFFASNMKRSSTCTFIRYFSLEMEPFRDAKIMQIVVYHHAREYIVVSPSQSRGRNFQFLQSSLHLGLLSESLVNSQQLLACMMIEGLDFAFRMLYHPLLHPFSKTPFIHLLREQNLERKKEQKHFSSSFQSSAVTIHIWLARKNGREKKKKNYDLSFAHSYNYSSRSQYKEHSKHTEQKQKKRLESTPMN